MRILLALLGLTTAVLANSSADSALEREEHLRAETEAWVTGRTEEWQPDTLVTAADGGLFGWLSIRGALWYPKLRGDMASNGERVDLDDELALDENELTIMPQITVTAGPIGFRFDFFLLEFDGQSNVNRDFDFGGFTFNVNEDVTSHLEINNYRLLSVFTLVKTSNFRLASLAGLSYYELRGRIEGETSGSGEENGDFPVPVVGVLVQLQVSRFTFEVEASGLSITYGDIDGTVFDVTVSAGITVFKIVALRGGYRIVSVDATVEDFIIDATLDGFFFGASIQF